MKVNSKYAVIDTGTSLIAMPLSDLKEVVQKLSGSKYCSQTDLLGGIYSCSCTLGQYNRYKDVVI